jgi:NAD(P)H-flavin reductase
MNDDAGFNRRKASVCKLVNNSPVNDEVFTLYFTWNGPSPQAGQFFMLRPLRTSVFLGRAISAAEWRETESTVKFLIARRGRGTRELADMRPGEEAELIGPLGNTWLTAAEPALKAGAKIALVGGGVGIAPLAAFAAEGREYTLHFYAGFRNGFRDEKEAVAMLGAAANAQKLILAFENTESVHGTSHAGTGRITDFFFFVENYDAVFACGPVPMLQALKAKCESARLPCFVSLESRMACGVGACLGCTIRTIRGNRRCCADGPVFNAQELFLDE